MNKILFAVFFLILEVKEIAKNIKEMPKSLIAGLLAIVFFVFMCWFFFLRVVIDDIETITYDWRSKISANQIFHDEDIIILAADDYTSKILEKYPELGIGRWPWQRKVWGDIVNFISKGNPRTIVFDIKFEGNEGNLKENRASDNYFAQSVKGKNIVSAIALSNARLVNTKVVDEIEKKIIDSYKGIQIDELIYKYSQFTVPKLEERFILTMHTDFYSNLPVKDNKYRKYYDNITFYSSSLVFPELMNSVKMLGVVNLKPGQNTVFREHTPLYRLTHAGGVSYVPSLPLAAAIASIPEHERTPVILQQKGLMIGSRQIPFDDEGKFLINWNGKARTYHTIPLSKVFLSHAYNKKLITDVSPEDLISPEFFKNKIVIIGQTSAGTDIHPTSMGAVYPGAEIIATVTDNILNCSNINDYYRRKFIKPAPFLLNLALTLVFCALTAFAVGKVKSHIIRIQSLAILAILFFVFAILVFSNPGIRVAVNMTYPALFMMITGFAAYAYQMYLENNERKMVESLFGKFVSPQVLEKLLKDKKSIHQEGQRKVMTVIFSDIRGFTSMSETTSADEVILVLNEYITEMVEVILKYNGTLDKYIGDAIMAFYNDPVEMEDHAFNAVKTALDMKRTLQRLNKKWISEGRQPLSIGIGINTGEMIVGHIGSPRLVDYTVIGDNVNLASRLEGLTKDYGVTIIISEATYEEVKNFVDAEYLDECTVKGRKQPVKIYELKNLKS